MKDTIFYDLFIGSFTDGFGMGILGFLIWVLTLITVGLISFGSLYLVDSVWLPENDGDGVVVEKWFVPAHTTTTFIMSGKVMVPVTNYYSDSWFVRISIDDITDDVSIYENYWNDMYINQKVDCKYKKGRIWKSIYIENVSF